MERPLRRDQALYFVFTWGISCSLGSQFITPSFLSYTLPKNHDTEVRASSEGCTIRNEYIFGAEFYLQWCIDWQRRGQPGRKCGDCINIRIRRLMRKPEDSKMEVLREALDV